MFSPELENLIQATLEDGMLEDYEKAALVKRAQAEGADLTELEIYINSILQKRKKEADKEKNAKLEQIAQKKKEALRKCPNCGESIPVMAISCPKCGYELSDQKAVSSVQILADKIEKISARLQDISERLQYMSKEEDKTNIEDSKDTIYEDMINTISVFPVPNSKQDIIEFLALSCVKAKFKGGLWGTVTGRIKLFAILVLAIAIIGSIIALTQDDSTVAWAATGYAEVICICGDAFGLFGTSKDILRQNKVAAAWRDKFEQVILKGRSLRADAEFTQQLDFYESKLNSK